VNASRWILPFAVVPDLRESANLESLSDAQLDERLGFRPVHLTNDAAANVAAVTERTNREWTCGCWRAVLVLVLGEAVLAWVRAGVVNYRLAASLGRARNSALARGSRLNESDGR